MFGRFSAPHDSSYWQWDHNTKIIGWRYADDETSGKITNDATITPKNPVQDMALGGQMYWRDLATLN